jgi:hypothetical protein
MRLGLIERLILQLMRATYPTSPALDAGTSETAIDPTNWNKFVDNINAIGADLVDARGDGQDFPGTDHTAGQCTDIDDMLQAIKHMIAAITGETNWYDAVETNLAALYGARHEDLQPEYPGGVWTPSLRGAAPSGNNTGTASLGSDVVSYVNYNYYEFTSSEGSLQDYYVAIRWTIPPDFSAWAESNAVQIALKTESATSGNCHVDVYIYKSGTAEQVASSENNASTTWAIITIDDSALGSWSAGDVMEMFIKLESQNSYYARSGRIRFNYTGPA